LPAAGVSVAEAASTRAAAVTTVADWVLAAAVDSLHESDNADEVSPVKVSTAEDASTRAATIAAVADCVLAAVVDSACAPVTTVAVVPSLASVAEAASARAAVAMNVALAVATAEALSATRLPVANVPVLTFEYAVPARSHRNVILYDVSVVSVEAISGQ